MTRGIAAWTNATTSVINYINVPLILDLLSFFCLQFLDKILTYFDLPHAYSVLHAPYTIFCIAVIKPTRFKCIYNLSGAKLLTMLQTSIIIVTHSSINKMSFIHINLPHCFQLIWNILWERCVCSGKCLVANYLITCWS